MALLNTGGIYKNPKSNILYGTPNSQYSNDEIKNYINTPGRTPAEVQEAALKYGVSAEQISGAMGGQGGYDRASIDKYLGDQGINKDTNTSYGSSTSGPYGNSTGIYKDPRANILYGNANKKYSDDEIRNYINTPGRTDADIEGAALKYGVTADQIANAMKDNPNFSRDKIDAYLANQGISRDMSALSNIPQATGGAAVKNTPITVDTNDTVEGRLAGITSDLNNPLNVQAQTFGNQEANRRGLLNSSIGVSAAQDALYKNAMPIATQDAATYYDAKKTNSGQDLTSGMFNSDQAARIGMFNTGVSKDLITSREGNQVQRDLAYNKNELDRYVANLDVDSRLAIENIKALSQETGYMGELGKTMMSLYQQTAADPNISPEVKDQIFANLRGQFETLTTLMPSFQKLGSSMDFGSSSVGGSGSGAGTGSGAGSGLPAGAPQGIPDGKGGIAENTLPKKVNQSISNLNILGYQPEPYILNSVSAYEKATGQEIDRNTVVPEQLIEDFKAYSSPAGYSDFYQSKDGTNKARNAAAYDWPALMQKFGAKDISELLQLFEPVQPPGTNRTDNPMFYVYNQEMLDRMK